MVAEDGGAKADGQVPAVSPVTWAKTKGSNARSGFRKPGAGVGDEDLDEIAFGGRLKTDGLLRVPRSRRRCSAFHGFNGKLKAMKHGLAELLSVAANPGQARSDAEPEFNGALKKLGAVKLLHIGQHFGDRDGGEQAILRTGNPRQAFQSQALMRRASVRMDSMPLRSGRSREDVSSRRDA